MKAQNCIIQRFYSFTLLRTNLFIKISVLQRLFLRCFHVTQFGNALFEFVISAPEPLAPVNLLRRCRMSSVRTHHHRKITKIQSRRSPFFQPEEKIPQHDLRRPSAGYGRGAPKNGALRAPFFVALAAVKQHYAGLRPATLMRPKHDQLAPNASAGSARVGRG